MFSWRSFESPRKHGGTLERSLCYMRFPHPDIENVCFLAGDPETLIKLMGEECEEQEAALIREYADAGLPPVTSQEALSAMFGYNPGFVWSLLNKTERHYRKFPLPKGKKKFRSISAPRVGLKLIQRWLCHNWGLVWEPSDCVHGFVKGRSHVSAATKHVNARWVISADISDFFPSIRMEKVKNALGSVGYVDNASQTICAHLACIGGGLAQGAPTSPILSNVVLMQLDTRLAKLAEETGSVYTRYADDIVFSGKEEIPDGLDKKVRTFLEDDGWKIAEEKFEVSVFPRRLKVHGLLVHGENVRLTKGYRNKLRAYRHLLSVGKISEDDLPSILGHIAYSDFIDGQ